MISASSNNDTIDNCVLLWRRRLQLRKEQLLGKLKLPGMPFRQAHGLFRRSATACAQTSSALDGSRAMALLWSSEKCCAPTLARRLCRRLFQQSPQVSIILSADNFIHLKDNKRLLLRTTSNQFLINNTGKQWYCNVSDRSKDVAGDGKKVDPSLFTFQKWEFTWNALPLYVAFTVCDLRSMIASSYLQPGYSLCTDLLSPRSESRHGAALVIGEVLRSHTCSAAVQAPLSAEPSGESL